MHLHASDALDFREFVAQESFTITDEVISSEYQDPTSENNANVALCVR